MLYACKFCGRIHPVGSNCASRPPPKSCRNSKRELRGTYRWTQKSKAIRMRDRYLCQWCLRQGRIVYDDVSVHHIIPLEENSDLAFDDDWLISLCDGDHRAAERGEIPRAELHEIALQRNAGTPPGVADL